MERITHTQTLLEMGACDEAVWWARRCRSAQAAWDACDRGDWMLWYLGKLAGNPGTSSHRRLVLLACRCARLALRHGAKGEKRPLRAIQAAEKWARGKAGVVPYNVAIAASAAHATYSSVGFAASYAANAACDDITFAASAATNASYACADSGRGRRRCLKKCADIVRCEYPIPPRNRKRMQP